MKMEEKLLLCLVKNKENVLIRGRFDDYKTAIYCYMELLLSTKPNPEIDVVLFKEEGEFWQEIIIPSLDASKKEIRRIQSEGI